jgi:FeS assembly SUF system regulator
VLRITKQTDYGIVLLSHMAVDPVRVSNAPELATETQLSPAMVSKILKILAREGLLASHRGVKGGYSLARPPEEITVAEIIWALEGPIAMTECIDEAPGECQQEPVCPLRGNWQLINRAIRDSLERLTLDQMAHPLTPKLVQLGDRRGAQDTESTRETATTGARSAG